MNTPKTKRTVKPEGTYIEFPGDAPQPTTVYEGPHTDLECLGNVGSLLLLLCSVVALGTSEHLIVPGFVILASSLNLYNFFKREQRG